MNLRLREKCNAARRGVHRQTYISQDGLGGDRIRLRKRFKLKMVRRCFKFQRIGRPLGGMNVVNKSTPIANASYSRKAGACTHRSNNAERIGGEWGVDLGITLEYGLPAKAT